MKPSETACISEFKHRIFEANSAIGTWALGPQAIIESGGLRFLGTRKSQRGCCPYLRVSKLLNSVDARASFARTHLLVESNKVSTSEKNRRLTTARLRPPPAFSTLVHTCTPARVTQGDRKCKTCPGSTYQPANNQRTARSLTFSTRDQIQSPRAQCGIWRPA